MKTRKILHAGLAFIMAAVFAAMPAQAADVMAPTDICIPMQPANLLQVDSDAELTKAVVDIMNEAVAASEDPALIDDRGKAWVWATEAKVACGNAYGYLQSSHREERSLNQCECFFRRMQHYLN